jgi:HSP20 family protein
LHRGRRFQGLAAPIIRKRKALENQSVARRLDACSAHGEGCEAHEDSTMLFAPVIRQSAYSPAARSVDRSFERFFNDVAYVRQNGTKGHRFTQDDQSWTLTVDLPGVAKDQLNVGIEGAVVRIESADTAARKVKAAYELPQDIDAATSTASLENGVLTLKLAKKVPVSNVTKLAIQ